MHRIGFIIALFISIQASGQDSKFLNYSWDTFPLTGSPDTIKAVKGQVICLERRIKDVFLNKDNYFEIIEVFHEKSKVLTNEALNYKNKIYIPMDKVLELVSIRARFISPEGKITEVPKENLILMENLENKGNYNSFVIEGAEAGGEIEFFYILRKEFQASSGYYIQEEIPKANFLAIISFPSKLEYLVRSYNGLPEFERSEDNDKTVLTVTCDYIPGLKEERYSFYKSNLLRYEFCMTHNTYQSSNRIYSWTKAGQNLYNNFVNPSKAELKALNTILKECDEPGSSPARRIRNIEDYVKSNIHVSDEVPNLEIHQALETRQNSENGMTRTFVNLFELSGIDYELVVTDKKDTHPFDPMFNGWNYLSDYLIYFPGIDKVLVPGDPSFRLGIFPYPYHGEYGLFLKPFRYDETIRTYSYEIKQLPYPDYTQNTDSIIGWLEMDETEALIRARVHRSFNGLDGQTFQYVWNFLDEDRKKELVSTVCNMGSEEIQVDKFSVTNENPEDIAIKPFMIDVEHSARSLVEYAGNDIIVKIGESIGAQSELYQTGERVLPVEIDVLRNYYRKITFKIPEGYTITNPEELNTHFEVKENGEMSCMFHSEYHIQDNVLIILSTEYYSDPYLPVELYEDFRKVINAAADFNKINIILRQI